MKELRKMATIVLQKYRKPGTKYFDAIAQFEYSGEKCKCLQNKFLDIEFQKHIMYHFFESKTFGKDY